MQTRSSALRPRFASVAPLALGDAAAILGAIACVLAAAILYLCFTALAIIDDGDGALGSASSPRVIVALHAPTADRTPRV